MDKIHWHPGFQGATEWELKANKKDLTFEYDHPLSKEPLKMDALIIKKDSDVIIQNDIGKLFKAHNVVEYKGVGDALNIDVIYKVLAYACLYKSLGEHVDEIPAEDVSITIMRAEYPKDLLGILESSRIHVEEKYPGIFYLTGRIQFDTQIIVFSRLDNTHPAYRILRPGASEEDIEQFLQEAALATEAWEEKDIRALLEVSVASNKELYRKLRKEKKDMSEAIQELFQDVIDERVEADKDKLERKGEKKGAEMLAILLQQLDKESDDFQLAIKGTSEDRERLYKKYEIVYEVVGEEEKKDDTAEDKKD